MVSDLRRVSQAFPVPVILALAVLGLAPAVAQEAKRELRKAEPTTDEPRPAATVSSVAIVADADPTRKKSDIEGALGLGVRLINARTTSVNAEPISRDQYDTLKQIILSSGPPPKRSRANGSPLPWSPE